MLIIILIVISHLKPGCYFQAGLKPFILFLTFLFQPTAQHRLHSTAPETRREDNISPSQPIITEPRCHTGWHHLQAHCTHEAHSLSPAGPDWPTVPHYCHTYWQAQTRKWKSPSTRCRTMRAQKGPLSVLQLQGQKGSFCLFSSGRWGMRNGRWGRDGAAGERWMKRWSSFPHKESFLFKSHSISSVNSPLK